MLFLSHMDFRNKETEWRGNQGREYSFFNSPIQKITKATLSKHLSAKHLHFPTSSSRFYWSHRSLSSACSGWQSNPLLSTCHFHTMRAVTGDGTTSCTAQFSLIQCVGSAILLRNHHADSEKKAEMSRIILTWDNSFLNWMMNCWQSWRGKSSPASCRHPAQHSVSKKAVERSKEGVGGEMKQLLGLEIGGKWHHSPLQWGNAKVETYRYIFTWR